MRIDWFAVIINIVVVLLWVLVLRPALLPDADFLTRIALAFILGLLMGRIYPIFN